MVSGFVTSPLDHERICFEDARPISMASKLLMSITGCSLLLVGGQDVADRGVLSCVFLDVSRVGRVGVGRLALFAFRDLGLFALVGRGVGVAVGAAHAREVDAELLGG